MNSSVSKRTRSAAGQSKAAKSAQLSPSTAATTVALVAAGSQTPRRLRRAAEILEAAREVFLDKGFERATVAEIAARVGVVEGLIYSYFPTKRDLLNEVLRGMYEPLIRNVADAFERIRDLRSRLRFLIWRHLRVYVEEPNLSRIVLHEVRTSPGYPKSVLHDLHVRYTSFTLRAVREAIADGDLPPDIDAEMVRSLLYGGIEHRMWSILFGRGSIDLESTADRYADTLMNGLCASASPAVVASSAEDVERRLSRLERIMAATAESPLANSAHVSRLPRRRKNLT